MTSTILKQVNTDLAAGNQSAVNADLAALQATLNAVDLDALAGSAAFAPEGGFPASAGALPGFGINPTTADANVGPYLSNLITAVQNLTTFLQTTPLATLTTAQATTYSGLQTALSTLVTQLPSLNPSTYGVVANMEQEDYLFNQVLPQYYQALAQATIQYLTANGFTASIRPRHRRGVFAADGSVDIVPVGWRAGDVHFVKTGVHTLRHGRGRGMAFQFGGLIELEAVSEIQMDLINDIYGPYFHYLATAATTIIINGAVQSWLGAQSLDGVITGADAEIQIFYAAPSAIEGENLDSFYANNQVYFIGPDQVNGVANIVTGVTNLVNGLAKSPPKDINAANKAWNTFKGFFATAKCLSMEASQPTNIGQPPGNCILTFSSSCVELDYNNGFNSVYNPSGTNIPSPVIILVWNVPSGAFSIGQGEGFIFSAAATQPPQTACGN
jgi:hypothetical protein